MAVLAAGLGADDVEIGVARVQITRRQALGEAAVVAHHQRREHHAQHHRREHELRRLRVQQTEFVRLQQQRETELAALGQHQAGAQRHAQFHFEQPPEAAR